MLDSKQESEMAAVFKVEKANAPAKWVEWKRPVGWIKLTDEDGNSVIGALMPDGTIHGDWNGSMGLELTRNDCAETIANAKALFA